MLEFSFFWSKFKKNKKITIDNLIAEQFNHTILEFIYDPFLLVIIILEPWNYEPMQEFFKAKDCSSKFKIFRKLIILFFNDIRLVVIFFLLMITVIDIIPTFLLIIRSIKRKYFLSEENKLIYSLNYKTEDFRVELRQIYNKNVKKFITTILFILNILLISRIIPLFRRTWPLFKKFFKNLAKSLKSFCSKEKIVLKDDILTKMPLIVISEICSYLNVEDINNLSQTNKKINEKTNINYIWQKIYLIINMINY